jgi:excisionase family DNA binding protein
MDEGDEPRSLRHRLKEELPAQYAMTYLGFAVPPGRMAQSDSDVLLTVDETAALLRTSRKAVYAMAERHQLPGVTRIGRRLLVRRDDLLSWLDERRAASPGGTRR